jgi:hypothetical protein
VADNKQDIRRFPAHRKKYITTITLDETERGLLHDLAEQNGLTRTEVMRMAIRRLAKELGAQT